MRSELMVSIGILVILAGFVIIFIGAILGAKDTNAKTKVAVGGFIGFIPFGFGNDNKLVWLATITSMIIIAALIFISYKIR